MTQEELDALMADDIDLDEEVAVLEEEGVQDDISSIVEEKAEEKAELPPEATDDNKIVNQLDIVTKDSEEKASEIFDRLDGISEYIGIVEEESVGVKELLEDNIEIFTKLSTRFDDVELFKTFLDKNTTQLTKIEDIIEKSQLSSDEIMMIMDTMQYQDIHRQKIERVINVMRSLIRYMNSLFGSNIKDEDRVSSAQHIEGDTDTGEVVSNEDIEALLASFGK